MNLTIETFLSALDDAAAVSDYSGLDAIRRGCELLRESAGSRKDAIMHRRLGEIDAAMVHEARSVADARNGWQHIVLALGDLDSD